ncbi:hypothetical protein BJV82DRAFT_116382 [Fennellomyces sp. T-0311]|nr:hypothetical protein BJV82DRAFT_116382 [Fennellomyces sp. T-0311]
MYIKNRKEKERKKQVVCIAGLKLTNNQRLIFFCNTKALPLGFDSLFWTLCFLF